MDINSSKLAAVDAAMNQIEKQFGKGSIMKLGGTNMMDVEAIPTGCLALNLALGIGGVLGKDNSRPLLTLNMPWTILCKQTGSQYRGPYILAAGYRGAGFRNYRGSCQVKCRRRYCCRFRGSACP